MELNQLRYPFAEQASQINGFVLKEKENAYIAGLGRDQLEHLASPMTKSESKYQRVQDKSETIEKRLESGLESETGLEYYSPSLNTPQHWVKYGRTQRLGYCPEGWVKHVKKTNMFGIKQPSMCSVQYISSTGLYLTQHFL